MKQFFILKDTETGRYYSGDYYSDFWVREIKKAMCFSDISAIEKEIQIKKTDDSDIFSEKIIEVLVIYKIS